MHGRGGGAGGGRAARGGGVKGNATLSRPASVANDNAPTEIMIIRIIFCGGVGVAAVEGAAIVGAAF